MPEPPVCRRPGFKYSGKNRFLLWRARIKKTLLNGNKTVISVKQPGDTIDGKRYLNNARDKKGWRIDGNTQSGGDLFLAFRPRVPFKLRNAGDPG